MTICMVHKIQEDMSMNEWNTIYLCINIVTTCKLGASQPFQKGTWRIFPGYRVLLFRIGFLRFLCFPRAGGSSRLRAGEKSVLLEEKEELPHASGKEICIDHGVSYLHAPESCAAHAHDQG